jgi:O-succinylbenzoate synthase
MGLDDISLDGIAAWRVRLELTRSFASARSQLQEREVVLIRIANGAYTGWGEAAPVPGHTRQSVDEIWKTLRSLVAAHGVDCHLFTEQMLRAAFNQAHDDLAACRAGVPLWEALGGGQRVAASAAIGTDEAGRPDTTQIDTAVGAGYAHMKLKITPRTDIRRVAALVTEFPGIGFGVDANGAFGASELPMLTALDGIGLEYIEQPAAADDLAIHSLLCKQMSTPICLDESAHSPAAIARIVASEAADIVNLKVGRFGTNAALNLATGLIGSGMQVRLGGLLESGIGRAHTIALAAHPCFTVVGDIAGSDRYFNDDLVRPQWRIEDGHFTLPSSPGIGVAIDEEAVRAVSVDSIAVS